VLLIFILCFGVCFGCNDIYFAGTLSFGCLALPMCQKKFIYEGVM